MAWELIVTEYAFRIQLLNCDGIPSEYNEKSEALVDLVAKNHVIGLLETRTHSLVRITEYVDTHHSLSFDIYTYQDPTAQLFHKEGD